MKLHGLLIATALFAFPAGLIAQDTADAVKNAFQAANDKMMHNMAMPMSGDADKDFVMHTLRLPHRIRNDERAARLS